MIIDIWRKDRKDTVQVKEVKAPEPRPCPPALYASSNLQPSQALYTYSAVLSILNFIVDSL
jgi:hypothetical protein